MEEKKSVFHYFGQVMTVFGFTMLVINLLCLAVGNAAKDLSSMFALGNRGVPAEIAFQFLLVSALIVGLRILFFTDLLIQKMPIWLRTVCLLASVILLIAGFILAFHWFPPERWEAWAMFLLCFGVCFLGSYFIMAVKEKAENRQMEEALRRLKEKEKQAE